MCKSKTISKFKFLKFVDLEECWDSSNLKEDEFEEFSVYIVHDRACDRVCPNRAQASLPRNLTLKPSQNQVNNVSYSFEPSQYMSRFRVFCISSCANIISLSKYSYRKGINRCIFFLLLFDLGIEGY